MQSDVTRWKCGACGRWNDIEAVKCAKCETSADSGATVVQKHHKHTPQEQSFYGVSVPTIVNELRSISSMLHELVQLMRERRDD